MEYLPRWITRRLCWLLRPIFGNIVLYTLHFSRKGAALLGLGNAYYAILARQVSESGLFDEAYYLEVNPDVAESGIPALAHYVRYGDQEGRMPMPLFDPGHYRKTARGLARKANALLHYIYVGRYRRRSPSRWFDVCYYVKQNKELRKECLDPLRHYLESGGRRGRSPCPEFDAAYYLSTNPEVAAAGLDPLIHYIRWGRKEGRVPAPRFTPGDDGRRQSAPRPAAFPMDLWQRVPRLSDKAKAVVDVIVPVYKGRNETLRCLYSVLTSRCHTPFELIVIDDATPDEHLGRDLERLAAEGLFTLFRQESNKGFVHSVNRGMSLHPQRDVVLLNSDTEVYNDWLDRLRRAAERDEKTGTVTPLSNNATIASYPLFNADNPFPLELSYEELDRLAAECNGGVVVPAPTAVGFCMYIRRRCLDDVGCFDAEAFGLGYGEENDFCQRAIRRGWRHVITADTFVHHWGATSFQGERFLRIRAALEILGKRYPDYHRDVDEFIRRDPLAPARRAMDWGRLIRQKRDRNILIVAHNRGGGTERHVQEDVCRLLAEGVGVYTLRPASGLGPGVRVDHAHPCGLVNLPVLSVHDREGLAGVIERLGISEIHTHGLVDFDQAILDTIEHLVAAYGLYWEVNIHDYKVLCPRLNLTDDKGIYCGEPPEPVCDRCLEVRGSPFAVTNIRLWRRRHHQALKAAGRVSVPNPDVAARLARYFPDVEFAVMPHEDALHVGMPCDADARSPDHKPSFSLHASGSQGRPPWEPAPAHDGGASAGLPGAVPGNEIRRPWRAKRLPPENRHPAPRSLRIVVIGAIGKIKGYDILLGCARDARRRRLPLRFVLMGYSMDDAPLRKAGVDITGRYDDREALQRLGDLHPDIVWLPSTWPETYSYTLSLALRGGYRISAFDLGAIAQRLRQHGLVEGLMPLDLVGDAGKINEFFLGRFSPSATNPPTILDSGLPRAGG